MGQFSEQDHPRGDGGRFAVKAKPGPDPAVTLHSLDDAGTGGDGGDVEYVPYRSMSWRVPAEDTAGRHAARVCANVGWSTLGDTLIELRDLGWCEDDDLSALTEEDAADLAYDHVGPALDDVEAYLFTEHQPAGDANHGGVYDDGVEAGFARLCREGGAPEYTASFLVGVGDRGSVPWDDLRDAAADDVLALYEVIVPHVASIADRVRHSSRL